MENRDHRLSGDEARQRDKSYGEHNRKTMNQFRYSASKNSVTLKTGLGLFKVTENGADR